MTMTYSTAFPDFDNGTVADMLLAAGWQDTSWKHDASPSFRCGRNVIWVDYVDADKREFPDASGYFVGSINEAGGYSDDVEGYDTIHGALSACYVWTVGYAPFADEPSLTPFVVARTLAEHASEALN